MDCAKVEGAMIDRIKAIVESGIMVMSHLGLTPHTRAKLGGYRVQGKTAKSAEIALIRSIIAPSTFAQSIPALINLPAFSTAI